MRKLKLLSLIMLLSVLWLTAVHAAAATKYSDGIFTFEKTDYNTAIVTDCSLTDEEIEIPEFLLGYPVIGIGDYAFLNKNYLKSVTLPASVYSIGRFAFAQNTEMDSITIPRWCEEIADDAFFGCPNITIYCYYGSTAHIYAVDKSFRYVLLDNELPDNVYIRGDADVDRWVSISDVTVIQRVLVDYTVPAFDERAADLDEDELDITDATKIQRYLAEFPDIYRIGEWVTIWENDADSLAETALTYSSDDTCD